ncbi:MAG: CD225/dispanin family protein [Prevotellaceae bacterium]|jgi:hypothetical protein|nr:CD225/dispanin family protein [Prevotellaceae bacterium]
MNYCSKCGSENHDDARYCVRCGNPLNASKNTVATPSDDPNRASMPDTYLWQSIVVTLLCCLPLGIPAIVYATQVEKYFFRGDIAAALRASRMAKNFCIGALVTGLIGVVFYTIYIAFLGGLAFWAAS